MNISDVGMTNDHCNLRQHPATDSEVVSEFLADTRVQTGDIVEGGSNEKGNKWIEVEAQLENGITVQGYLADYLVHHVG